MATVEVRCAHCATLFPRPKGRAREAEKNGWEQFCSPECLSKHRLKGEYKPCRTCGVSVWVAPGRKSTPNGRVFCSSSCAASYNNQHRPARTQESKERTAEALRKRAEKICVTCGNSFYPTRDKQTCCSTPCRCVLQFGSLPYTREETITLIQQLHTELKRTPNSKEVRSKLVHAAMRFFGSWNKAIKHLGIPPNMQWGVRGKIPCKDGHRADSISEKLVDDWLFQQGIQHERGKGYPEGKYTCDFFLPKEGVWVEYFGLLGQSRDYDATVDVKREMAKKFGLVLLEVLPTDLYPENKLEERFRIISL